MKYRLAIFDFDGTLADSGAWFLARFDEIADEFKFKRMSTEDREAYRCLEARELLRRLEVPLWRLPQIMKRVREMAARDVAQIKPFPHVEQMLSQIQAADIQTGLVTSNSEANARLILGPKICAHINHYRCGATLLGKQHKIRQLVRDAKVPAAETIYIGDELRDATAARKAEVAFGAVSWGYTPVTSLAAERPALIFPDVLSIPALLLN